MTQKLRKEKVITTYWITSTRSKRLQALLSYSSQQVHRRAKGRGATRSSSSRVRQRQSWWRGVIGSLMYLFLSPLAPWPCTLECWPKVRVTHRARFQYHTYQVRVRVFGIQGETEGDHSGRYLRWARYRTSGGRIWINGLFRCKCLRSRLNGHGKGRFPINSDRTILNA